METVTDALNQSATYGYFVDGNLALIDYSDAGTPDERFTYDSFYDRVSAMTDGIGTTEFAYHPDDGSTGGTGSLARADGPFADDTLKYTYDALGHLKKREIVDDATYTTASYSEEYAFDTRSRVDGVINNLGTFDYSYVGQSNRIDSMDYPNSMRADYTYTNVTGDHLIQQIKHLNSAAIPEVISQFDYTYRQDRNIETWTTVQNGASSKQWTFGYDAALRLTRAVRKDSTTQAALEQFAYGYDKAGNRVRVTNGSAHSNYPANNLNQTTSMQGFGATKFSGTLDEPALVTINRQSAKVMSDGGEAPYTFEALVDLAEGDNTVTIEATDGNDNTTSQSYSVIADGVQKILEYDLNGNLRFEKDASGTVLREFQWDAKNRLLAIQDAATGSETVGTKRSEFEYDGFDRRVQIVEKTCDGTAWITDSDDVFIWNGSQILQKRDSTGSTVVRSYFGNGFEEGGEAYYYTKDHLGSIREVVAANGTTIEAIYDYSPWGEATKIGGSGVESDFLYTGHFYHESGNLHLTLYRAYDPELGVWLSRDPIAENGGINLYAYVLNNPINYVDLFGLDVYEINNPSAVGGNGHTGAIVGNGSGPYTYHSFGNGGKSGSFTTDDNYTEKSFNSLSDAMDYAKNEGYTRYNRFRCSQKDDEKARKAAKDRDGTDYHPTCNNCQQMVNSMFDAAGITTPGRGHPNISFRENSILADSTGSIN